MPSGVHFTPEIKEIFFRVIHFVESEKNGPQIPMNNSTARITAMLGISVSSLNNLRKEMKMIRETREAEESEEEENRSRLGSASQNQPANVSHKKKTVSAWSMMSEMERPPPRTVPKVIGRPSVTLSEEADDEIRFQFHLLLAEKIYPTVSFLLERLLTAHSDFPIRSETSLRRHMHRLGFSYRKTSKVKLALGSNTFIAQRASYFRNLTNLRQYGALIMFHDETWINVGEEKRSIWVDDTGTGRIRKGDGKGARLGISAMIDTTGFHLPTVDIFDCSKEHSMTSSHFVEWIRNSAFRLREDNGPDRRIAIVIDNATWHSELTETSKPAKRSMLKNEVVEWLENHDIKFDFTLKKSELLEIAARNKPLKEYKVDTVALEYDVEIVRLPVRHCSLNPIETVWAALKDYIRKNNTTFSMTGIRELASEFIAGFDDKSAQAAILHAEKVEETYKKADDFVENSIEPQLLDDTSDDEMDYLSDSGEDVTET